MDQTIKISLITASAAIAGALIPACFAYFQWAKSQSLLKEEKKSKEKSNIYKMILKEISTHPGREFNHPVKAFMLLLVAPPNVVKTFKEYTLWVRKCDEANLDFPDRMEHYGEYVAPIINEIRKDLRGKKTENLQADDIDALFKFYFD